MYFRVEDENGYDPNLRKYGSEYSCNTPVDACDADILIANEIRGQINNCNNSIIFSYSKSLGIALFKYNYLTDNPIHLIPLEGNNWVEFDVMDDNGLINNYGIPYYITNLDYPIKRCFDNKRIILKNYCIDVDNDIQLDTYLRNYTNVGKKKIATCEKDSEVIIRHVVDDYIITEYINEVYLIYALQHETRLLNCIGVVEKLIEMFSKEIKNQNEVQAFVYLVSYLQNNWSYEEQISKTILEEKRQAERLVGTYDAYFMALDIMDGDIEEAWRNCSYYLPYRMLSYIWNIFANSQTFLE